MSTESIEVSVKGQIRHAPAIYIDGRPVIIGGGWIRTASVHDEPFWENGEAVHDPEAFITKLKQLELKPDIFKFAQKITDPVPKYKYLMEWDNYAVLHITTYQDWLKNKAKRDVKENIRRATREGVVVRACEYNDEFVRGIKSLFDETPIRQGRRYWHYKKDFEDVKKENGTYRERAEYIGAFFEDDLIGFLKMVYSGNIAKTMQVITKERFFQKRPANGLLAKAVEICAEKGITHFNYGYYEYPGKKENSLSDFKSRHGFVRVDFPIYHVPLTLKGKVYLALRLHRKMKTFIPSRLLAALLKTRATVYGRIILPLMKWRDPDLSARLQGKLRA